MAQVTSEQAACVIPFAWCGKGGPMAQVTSEQAACVIPFACFGDPSTDTHEASPPKKDTMMDIPPHPIATHHCDSY
jgi:hypothetical protein